MKPAGKFAWCLVAVLGVVHYDFWFWSDRTLLLGFVPIGLAFQVLISLLAGLAWLLVVKFAWPTHIEEWADTPLPGNSGEEQDAR